MADSPAPKEVAKDRLYVTVRSRMGLAYDGELDAVTSYNSVGQFDILPQHANFVSMITKKIILHKGKDKAEEINVDKGVMMVSKNRVEIFIGVGTL